MSGGFRASCWVPLRAIIICSPAEGRLLSVSSHLWIPCISQHRGAK